MLKIALVFELLIFLIFLWFGIYQLWRTISSTAKAFRAKKWPAVHANLDRFMLETHPAGNSRLRYRVDVKYTYHIGGVEYQGDTLSFGYVGSTAKETQQEIYKKLKYAKYAKTVEARYNPRNPAEACLFYEINRLGLFFNIAIPTIWILFTILIGFFAFTILNHDATINNSSERTQRSLPSPLTADTANATINNNPKLAQKRINTILLMCGDDQWGEVVCQDISLTTEVAAVFDNYFKNGRNHSVAALDFMEAIEACGFNLGCIDKTIKDARKAQK